MNLQAPAQTVVLRARGMLQKQGQAIPNVLATPSPDVEILKFTPLGPVLAVRPSCNHVHYWQVFFETNRAIRETFSQARFPAPEHHLYMPSAAFLEQQDGRAMSAN